MDLLNNFDELIIDESEIAKTISLQQLLYDEKELKNIEIANQIANIFSEE